MPGTTQGLAASQDTMFNFKAPVTLEDGSLLIIPNFPASGPINKQLAIQRNSEIPRKLQVAGELTKVEDLEIGYTHLRSRQAVFVGRDEKEAVFKGMFWDEKAISELAPHALECMQSLRKSAFHRVPGSKYSELEGVLAGGIQKINPTSRRYVVGSSVNPQQLAAGGTATNAGRLAEIKTIAQVASLLAVISVDILQKSAPEEVLEMLFHRAELDVPLTAGIAGNAYFNSFQFNFSDLDAFELKASLGEVGGLHVDANDDPRRWTVLLALTNLPDNYWPGRTCITSLRLYAVMAPCTCLVFQGVDPHLSIGPHTMVGSDRQPYVPSYKNEPFDPALYLCSRLCVVSYPKRSLMNKSPQIIRTITPQLLLGQNGEVTHYPDSSAIGDEAFGSDPRNRMEYFARLEAWNYASLAMLDPARIIPTAEEIAHMHRWMENGVIQTPRVSRIQIPLSRLDNSEFNNMMAREYEDWGKRCSSMLSQGFFVGRKKGGTIVWVNDIRSSLEELDSMDATVKTEVDEKAPNSACIHNEFGPRPYKCNHCDNRSLNVRGCVVHTKNQHRDVVYQQSDPTLDPNYEQPQKYRDAGVTEDHLGVEVGQEQGLDQGLDVMQETEGDN